MSPLPSVSYSITIRLEFAARSAAVSDITSRIEKRGATVTALDVSASGPERMRADITVLTAGHDHAIEVVDDLKEIEGVELGKVSDRTFLAHLGGKLTVESKLPIRHRDDLSMIYTPGVARVVKAIAENPEDARRLTIKRNTVAVVSDGSAILGLGDLGPLAAMPVMEGKAALFKRFANIDAFPICLDAHSVDDIVSHVKAIAPVFAGINLEDISAPRCFEIEDRLRAELDIPVFHDDQHGTAIVVVAALRNALRVVEKDISTARIVLPAPERPARRSCGCCAPPAPATSSSPTSTASSTRAESSSRAACPGSPRSPIRASSPAPWPMRWREPMCSSGSVPGTSSPAADVATMAGAVDRVRDGQPDPRDRSRRRGQVRARSSPPGAATSPTRSTTCSPSPGVFRGLLDAHATRVSDRMLLAAAKALADVVAADELNPTYIVPSVFHEGVTKAVASAVEKVAREDAGTIDTHHRCHHRRLRRRDHAGGLISGESPSSGFRIPGATGRRGAHRLVGATPFVRLEDAEERRGRDRVILRGEDPRVPRCVTGLT